MGVKGYPMQTFRQNIGKIGEGLALDFLRRQGYKIITRNFFCRFGEIDLIARQAQDIVFIEVRTISAFTFCQPEESLGPRKINHLRRCAQFYIAQYAVNEEFFRFDFVSVILTNPPTINLIKNAF